MCG
ncbi:hypothetical protein E2320_013927, partial [Naja naja]|jgi:hypothetical protein